MSLLPACTAVLPGFLCGHAALLPALLPDLLLYLAPSLALAFLFWMLAGAHRGRQGQRLSWRGSRGACYNFANFSFNILLAHGQGSGKTLFQVLGDERRQVDGAAAGGP